MPVSTPPKCLFAGAAVALMFQTASLQAAVLQLDVLTVSLCDQGSSECFEPDIDQSFMNRIFGQADIFLNFLPSPAPVTLDLAAVSNSAGQADAFSLLSDFASAAAGDIPPLTAVMGFGPRLTGNTVGAAYLGAPSLPFGIVSAEGTSTALQSFVTAHELGHILGVDHTDEGMGSLMDPVINVSLLDDPDFLPGLAPGVAEIFRSSSLLQERQIDTPDETPDNEAPEISPPTIAAVPLPPAVAGFLVALGMLAVPAARKRRRSA
ncbi:hypothetical protein [uncultured Roseobacter sp.]|uniref:hypothetical protein n=1 Tax=uncultured Roseobacter sp. TaxID=114847 RepID=UPI0026342568|nr:hypothetical protein [uncultured Roseobacter sp.]